MFIILFKIIFVGSTDKAEKPLRWNKLFCNPNRNDNLFHVRCGQSFFLFYSYFSWMDPHVTVSQTGISLLNLFLKVLRNYHKLDVNNNY